MQTPGVSPSRSLARSFCPNPSPTKLRGPISMPTCHLTQAGPSPSAFQASRPPAGLRLTVCFFWRLLIAGTGAPGSQSSRRSGFTKVRTGGMLGPCGAWEWGSGDP